MIVCVLRLRCTATHHVRETAVGHELEAEG